MSLRDPNKPAGSVSPTSDNSGGLSFDKGMITPEPRTAGMGKNQGQMMMFPQTHMSPIAPRDSRTMVISHANTSSNLEVTPESNKNKRGSAALGPDGSIRRSATPKA